MIVGCYALDLYCDNEPVHGKKPMERRVGQFTGETGGQARQEARRVGWLINLGKNTCVCPKCALMGVKP
jgi:hypothetical protein